MPPGATRLRVALADACVIYIMNRRNILGILAVLCCLYQRRLSPNRRQRNADDANLASQSTGW